MLVQEIKHSLAKIRDKIVLPGFDGWLRIYLTLECNLKCKYCVHNHNLSESKALDYTLKNWQEWVEIVNRIGRDVIFTGGEPLLYPDFVKLLNGIRKDIKVKIYTNFGVNTEQFIADIQRPVIFFGTYHPSSGPVETFINTINKIDKSGKFQGTIHMVGWKEQVDFLKKVKNKFSQHNWYVYIDKDQYLLSPGSSLQFKKKAKCTRRIYLIAPDGNRYQCVSKMLRQRDPLGNIFEQGLGAEKIDILCHEYGYCNPCDSLGETKIKILEE